MQGQNQISIGAHIYKNYVSSFFNTLERFVTIQRNLIARSFIALDKVSW